MRPTVFLKAALFMVSVATGCLSAQMARGQTVIYVNAAAPAGGNGQSWGAAYRDLQSALVAGETIVLGGGSAEIWASAGVYKPSERTNPSDPRSATFRLRNQLPVYGGFSGTEVSRSQRNPTVNVTHLSGDLAGDDPPLATPAFGSNTADNAYHVLTANQLGGTYSLDGLLVCGGRADLGLGVSNDSTGGGLVTLFGIGSATITDCVFYRNFAGQGGGITGQGSVSTTLIRCRFISNHAVINSGAYDMGSNAGLTATGCAFIGNSSDDRAGAMNGGGTKTLRHCTFAANTAAGPGGAFENTNNGAASLIQCVFWGNVGQGTANAITTRFNSSTTIRRCILQGGCGAITSTGGAALNCEGTNLDANPMFINLAGADGTLGTLDDDIAITGLSPCVDAGDNADTTPGVFTDLRGHRRIHDGDNNGVATIDIGAFEFGAPPYSSTLYARAGLSGGGNNGSSWADAFRGTSALQSALTVVAQQPSGAFSEVWVATGTYTPAGFAGSRSASFQLQNNLAICGGFNGTETTLSQRNIAASPTILSGDLNGDDSGTLNYGENSFHVVSSSGTASSAVLDGVSVRAGNANGVNTNFETIGGNVLLTDSRATLRNCRFESGQAFSGGGGVCSRTTSDPAFVNCVFSRNTCSSGPGGYYLAAGGATLTGCVFESNYGAIAAGALWARESTVTRIVGCDFIRNRSPMVGAVRGGSVDGLSGCQMDILSCRFLGNVTEASSFSALNCVSSTVNVADSLFVGNASVTTDGTGNIAFYRGNIAFRNCTIVSNVGNSLVAGGIYVDFGNGGSFSLYNSLLFDNRRAGASALDRNLSFFNPQLGAINISYSSIEGWTGSLPAPSLPGPGVDGSNPLFVRMPSPGADLVWGTVDDDYGDLRLQQGSPAIDSGDSSAVPADVFDINNNGNTTESLPIDLFGFPRFVDDPAVPNAGVGSPPVDRGCYESQVNCLACPGPREWRSPLGGAFEFPGNWSPSVPQPSHDTFFNLSAAYPVTFATSGSVTNDSATVRDGDVSLALANNTWSLTSGVDPSLVIGDTPNRPATLEIANGRVNAVECRIGSTSGSVGTVKLQGSGNAVTPSARLATTEGLCVGCQGTGTLSITGGARVSCLYGFLGEQSGATGQVNINGPGSRLDAPFFLAIDNGNVNVSNGGTLATGTFGAIYLFPGGSISGDGTISGHVVNFGGIAPGNSPGTLTINGNYDQVGTLDNLGDVSGKLIAQASGAGSGQFDKLVVNGAATLGGGLSLSLLNNYVPAAADQLQVISATGGLTTPFDVVFFPALDNTAAASKYFRTAYSGLRGPGAGSVTINLGNLATSPSFNTPSQYTLDNPPNSVAVGDLNGDTLPDVAITIPDAADPTGATGVVVVLINQGGSGQNWQGFAPHLPGNPTTIPPIPVGLNPTAAAITKLDSASGATNHLIVANTASNSLSVLRFVSGAVQTVATQATDPEPLGLAATDFSGLGGPSNIVVVACGGGAAATTGSMTMLANTSSGGAVSFIRRNVPGPQGHRPVNPRPFNPDQDKDIDLAVVMTATNGGADIVAVYTNGLNPGAAVPVPDLYNTLGAAAMVPVGSGPVQTLAGKLSPITATNPAGKKEDLITVNTTGNSISVVINTNLMQDAPTFAPAVEYSFDVTGVSGAAVAPRSAVIADLDSTGTLDVAVVANNPSGTNRVVKLLRNDSTTNLGVTQVAFAQMPDLASGSKPLAIVSADLDADGQTDLVTINSTSGRDTPHTVQVVRNALGSPATSVGACCNGAGCVVEAALQCAGTAQRFAGLGTACNVPGNFRMPCCRGDFDQSGALALADIFSFLNAWFAGDHRADTDDNGQLAIADIFTFLNAWFAGC